MASKSIFVAIFMDPGERLDELDVHVYDEQGKALADVERQLDLEGEDPSDRLRWVESNEYGEHKFVLYCDGDQTAMVVEKELK